MTSRTPLAISTSNSVTVGPATQLTTRDGMSKVASVSVIACAVERCSVSLALCLAALSLVLASRPMRGSTKPSIARGDTVLAIGTVLREISGSVGADFERRDADASPASPSGPSWAVTSLSDTVRGARPSARDRLGRLALSGHPVANPIDEAGDREPRDDESHQHQPDQQRRS